MSRIPSFCSPLLHKHAYGLDISGDVVDGGQKNLKDTRYEPAQPHPQQFTTGPDDQTLEPGAKLYHGTTMEAWQDYTQPKSLVLTMDPKAARIEAENCSESAQYHDEIGTPIVVSICFGDLSGYDLGPNAGSGVTEDASWQESLRDIGSLRVSGDIQKLKLKFHRIP